MRVILLIFSLCFGLIGCFASCATGDPLGMFAYWPHESFEALTNPKPYGVHWIKEGSTQESRRTDSWDCGADQTLIAADHVIFSEEKRGAVRLPFDDNDYGPDGRLTKEWISCMSSKGYMYIEKCDSRCAHQ